MRTKVIIVLLVLIMVSSSAFAQTNTDNPLYNGLIQALPVKGDEPYHILMLGIDSRDPDNWDGSRTDTIIIVTIDKDNNDVKFTSIMRDTYVEIPEHGSNRVNAAYAFGGVDLVLKTLKDNFSINVQDYVVFDFDTVRSITESLGGVEVIMDSDEVRVMNSAFPKAKFSKGVNKLDGDQTLHFCRIRKGCGGDFGRTRRQRDVLRTLFNMAPTLTLPNLLSLVMNKATSLETSIDSNLWMGWGLLLYQMQDASISDLRIPVDGGYKNATINGKAVLSINLKKNVQALLKFINGKTVTFTTLKMGDSSEDVLQLQNELKIQGWLTDEPTGEYDEVTENAVKAFQKAKGLKADGIAGTDTQSVLFGI